MKRKYFLAILFLIAISCNKDANGLTAGVQGTWELASSDYAWAGHHDYPPGNGNTFIFNGNSYSQKVITPDTTYLYSGTFSIYTGKPCDFANEQTLIKFDTTEEVSSFSLTGGKLSIGTTECISDGGSSTYRKIQ